MLYFIVLRGYYIMCNIVPIGEISSFSFILYDFDPCPILFSSLAMVRTVNPEQPTGVRRLLRANPDLFAILNTILNSINMTTTFLLSTYSSTLLQLTL